MGSTPSTNSYTKGAPCPQSSSASSSRKTPSRCVRVRGAALLVLHHSHPHPHPPPPPAGEPVSNHDELMSNFFAQPDALALGKTPEEVAAEGTPADLVPHKVFAGDRPSLSLLLPALNPYTTGQLLALFEHRTAVEGFVWGICSFDQWGVELGKKLATNVRGALAVGRGAGGGVDAALAPFNSSTQALLRRYLA